VQWPTSESRACASLVSVNSSAATGHGPGSAPCRPPVPECEPYPTGLSRAGWPLRRLPAGTRCPPTGVKSLHPRDTLERGHHHELRTSRGRAVLIQRHCARPADSVATINATTPRRHRQNSSPIDWHPERGGQRRRCLLPRGPPTLSHPDAELRLWTLKAAVGPGARHPNARRPPWGTRKTRNRSESAARCRLIRCESYRP
jgi:hypothetical protein